MIVNAPSTITSPTDPFSDLDDAAKNVHNKDTGLLKDITAFLARTDIQGTKGKERFSFVCKNFKNLSFEEAYRVLDLDGFQDEVENKQAYRLWLTVLNFVRIIFTLLPLIMTWFALSFATWDYQHYIAAHPKDVAPFLTLWQNGFATIPNQAPLIAWLTGTLTFSNVAITDVGILIILLVANVFSFILEARARNSAKAFANDLRNIANRLLKIIANASSVSLLDSDEGIDKVVKVLRVVMKDVFEQVTEAVEHFDQAVDSFRQDLQVLTQDMNNLTAASTTMGAASSSMSSASTNMTNAAIAMTQSSKDIDMQVQRLNTHVSQLNVTEQAIDQNMKMVAAKMQTASDSMNKAAKDVSGVANDMNDAVAKLDTTTKQLPSIVTQMSTSAQAFASETQNAANVLQKVINAIAKLSGVPIKKRKRFILF